MPGKLQNNIVRISGLISLLDFFGSIAHPKEPRFLLGVARIHDLLNNTEEAATYYKRVLSLDASHVESMACLAANHFYNDQVT